MSAERGSHAGAAPARPRVVAVIPARGGSKGLARKNLRPLAGKPLVVYSIEAARGSALVDRVLVSTEDQEIADIARRFGAEVPFLRPPELAQDITPTEPVLKHAIDWLADHEGYAADIVLFLQPTDIFRTRAMVDGVVRRLLDNPSVDSCFVAYATHKNFWRRQGEQWVRLAPDLAYGPRQMREHLYREDTGLACATRARFIREGKRLGPRVDILVTHDEASWIDIHDDFSFWLAEKVVAEWGRTVND